MFLILKIQCRILFGIFLLYLAFLTMALVLAVNEDTYSKPVNTFGLFCGIVVILATVTDIVLEILDFMRYWKVKAVMM